ncbi:hypothetical protein [Streptomyces sp. NPDC056296]|uniref:hypothetical protein n=1 Tax=Streptomyces sp. NPDC056296 TaxID=3345775 RepID=UPI0035D990A0
MVQGKPKSEGGCNNWGFLSGICKGVGESFYGLVSNAPHMAEYFAWPFDEDCRGDGGGPGTPGCDYGSQFDNWIAEEGGYDNSSDSYQVPSALAAIFGGPAWRSKNKPYAGTLVGPTTKKTHWAEVEVRNAKGELLNAYTVRSGSQTPEEKALGYPRNAAASHTEARVTRMSGATPKVQIGNDRYANLTPVNPGDTVAIYGTNPACTGCQASMRSAAQETRSTFLYITPDGKTWSSAE